MTTHGKSPAKQLLIGLLAVLAVLPAGCGRSGPPRTAVKGQVTLDGSPMSRGRIVFVPSGTAPAAAASIEQGVFTLDRQTGPGEGTYKVMIFGNEKQPVPMDDPEAFAKSDLKQRPPVDPVAAEFNVATKLEAQVRATGENTFTFAVTSIPKSALQGN